MTNKQPIELIETKPSLDIPTIREKLAQKLVGKQGKYYWRSLEEIAETKEFQAYVQHEFPHWATRLNAALSRRNFLKFMGASIAMFGLSGCQGYSEPFHPQPLEKIAPYTKQPEIVVPGKPLFYASAFVMGGFANGVLVENHLGRPTKIEGNPDHPASLGATDAITQADILGLYDPERSQAVKRTRRISGLQSFLTEFEAEVGAMKGNGGAGLHILTQTITSPTLGSMLESVLADMPSAKWHQYEPVNRDSAVEGAKLAFGEPVGIQYHFDQANVILSLDSDVLTYGPGNVRYAHDFADQRRVRDEGSHEMNRLYAVESMPTGTGSVADNRLPLPASQIEWFARSVASELGVSVSTDNEISAEHKAWIDAVVADLQSQQGSSLVIAGDTQPPAVHALAHAMNDALGNVGTTVTYSEPVEINPINQIESLTELVSAIDEGSVDILVIIGGNPAFDAPVDLNLTEALQKVRLVVHQNLYENETSALSHWHLPSTHYLETWGDARAYDGTVSIMQPLISPLFDGLISPYQLVSLLQGNNKSSYDLVQEYWTTQIPEADFQKIWEKTVHDGFMADTALSEKAVTLQNLDLPNPSIIDGLEINFRPDPTIWDGRYANNGWLQELPKPFTRLTWDNAAIISPTLAEERGLNNGDVIALNLNGTAVRAPVWVLPGHAKNSLTVHYGYGRRIVGRVGEGSGFDAYLLRSAETPWFSGGLEIRVLNDHYELASTQNHYILDDPRRDIIRSSSLEEFLHHDDDHGHGHGHHEPISLMREPEYHGHAWGMSVDLGNCIGCNACVTACNVENNIPVVGKEEVLVGREMHWMRVDHYFSGEIDNPSIFHQPLMCHHCEQAPCEIVCPVAATTHSSEGLNDMVYNRCVGTRFCANNCPYKVRRFNFYQYQDDVTPIIELRHNPDVTVRSRGVMEKCSYCVQRISDVRIEAKKENRKIEDGEILTACQQACPTKAIVFGDINDHDSEVAKLKHESRSYGLLAVELNTRPRTTYLAQINNPNPAIETHGEA